jgi:hypothetical protein
MDIITTTELQKKIGQITDKIGEKYYIVTNRGKARVILLPYFDGCDALIEDYMEDYEILMNKDKLQKWLKKSADSGESDLVI